MSRRSYSLIALLTLPLPMLAAYAIGSRLITASGLVAVLLYALVVLGCVIVWGIALLPLRKRAGFTPISDELRQIRESGGLGVAVAREREELERRAKSSDPHDRATYHSTFALVSVLFAAAGVGISWLLWDEGYVMVFALAAVIVCPVLALYHGVQWLRARS